MSDGLLTDEKKDYYVNKIMDEMRKIVPTVYRDCANHKAGEVVIGCDCMGEMQFLVTFDANKCAEMDKHIVEGTLFDYVHRQLYSNKE